MKKRLLSMLLASVLLIGVMPVQIPAAEEIPEEETTEEMPEDETTEEMPEDETTEEMPEDETTEMVSEDEIIGNDENGIPDRVLYQAVLSAGDFNGDGILTKEEAAGITELEKSYSLIENITGISHCINLEELYLQGNHISNISVLSQLTRLKTLWLQQNYNISDISALSNLTNLRDLHLGYNEISDISALSGLTNLYDLDLQHNQISDINAISGLINLNTLDLHHNNITDFSALSGLEITNLRVDEPVSEDEIIHNDEYGIPDLVLYQKVLQLGDRNDDGKLTKEEAAEITNLWLVDEEVKTIEGIQYCTNLSDLDLWWNYENDSEISDISVLSSLTNLSDLSISNCPISDISALSSLTNLSSFHIQGCPIGDISALSSLTDLSDLSIFSCPISDINVLGGLTNLSSLSMDNNQISDISALGDLTNLSSLSIGNNQISDISALSGLTNLSGLYMSGNQISDISALSELINLSRLYMRDNQISDISALSGLVNLSSLDIGSNQISDIGALRSLVNLMVLYLDRNNISDVSSLSSLTKLEGMNLSYNNISNISSLGTLTNLSWLDMGYNQTRDFSALQELFESGHLNVAGNPSSVVYESPTDSTENASAVIDGETIEFPVNPDAEAGCTTDKQKSAFEIIMEMIRRLIEEVGEDATKIYAPILQEYAKISVKKVWLAECIDIQKPDGVDMSQGVAVTFPAKVNKGDTVIVLHLDEEGNWEQIKDAKATADGWITGTFRSLSPVFYFKVETESAVTGDGSDSNGNTSNGSYDGWAGVSAEQKAKLMQESLAQKTAVVASPKTDDANANINASVMLLLAAALCGVALYGRRRRIKA